MLITYVRNKFLIFITWRAVVMLYIDLFLLYASWNRSQKFPIVAIH